MFKNILVPTDGSSLSLGAAKQAIALGKATGARITGLHVAPAYKFNGYEDYFSPDVVLPSEYEARVAKVASKHLDRIRKLADRAGVKFTGHHSSSDFPADSIVKAVKKYGCDSIVMGSHGRGGLRKLFLGSETQKVLASAKVPVVVTH
ncbi:MAG: universal stress protein [Burkholderiales bacterium]